MTTLVSPVHSFRILVVGKVRLWDVQQRLRKTKPILITERLWEIFAHQGGFQGRHIGTYLVLIAFPFIQRICPENKAALARPLDINFPFRPDDNRHLIVHECSGFEPGDAEGIRAIRDFIATRTDPNRPPAERLHAIW